MNAQQLKNAILQEAITGRLVPQDPNDEPASVLLDKIRKEKAKLVKEGKLKKKDLEEKPISKEEIPFEIPESWEWVRIKYLIIGTGAGKSPSCVKRPKSFNEWGVITTTAVQFCDFHPNENKVLPSNFQINFEQIVRDKDLLITRAGPRNRTGIVCVVNKPCGNLILSDKTVRIDYIRDYCDPFYLMYTLNNPIIHNLIMSATVGMADSQVNISQNNIQDILVPLPPLAEQHRIVAKIEELLPKVEEYGKAQEALDKLNASVLLDKIRKEKAKLVKEGKLKKKDLIETPISKDEIPFEIPESWEWCKLGYVAEIARGGSPRPIKEYLTDESNGLNWIKIGDTEKGGIFINSCKEKIKPEGLKKTRMVHPGDFLLTNSMSFGRPYITNIKGCIHDGWLMISPYAGAFDQLYLYYLLSSVFAFKQFSDKVAGAVVQNLNSDKVAASCIPLPPLAEQHRIVAKIEELLTKIDKLKTE